MPELTREIFGNIPRSAQALLYIASVAVLGLWAWGVARRVRLWRKGRPVNDPIPWRAGLRNIVRYVLLQRRVRGRGAASVAHVLLFGGFVTLFIGTVLVAFEHNLAAILGRDRGNPVFHRGLYYAVYEVVMEFAGLALIAGCAWFGWRRWREGVRPGRPWSDGLVLPLLAGIGLTGYVLEGFRIVREEPSLPWLSFAGAAVAEAISSAGLTQPGVDRWHLVTWWVHAALALGLIAFMPYGRLLHAVAGTIRLAAGVERPGSIAAVAAEDLEQGEVGVSRIDQFSRRQLIELDACVSCGRCEEACPAFEAGKPLSPRTVVETLRAEMDGVSSRNGESEKPARALGGAVISAETLWSCTTCSACVDLCPLGVSPVGFIVDLRRSLVADAQLKGPPAQALQKTGRTGNPWGLPGRDRLAWAEGLDVPTVAQRPDCEVVYWVGCAAAYDRRLQKIARSMVRLLRAAQVNFAVLGNEESCTGEAARRMGDEYLFQELAAKNIETFRRHSMDRKRIVSHCPHCVNSLRQDYSQAGMQLQVVHHTEFLDELVRSGRLAVTRNTAPGDDEEQVMTYHDPCYLARAQGVVDAPRRLLASAAGSQALVELPRHGRRTACCGAGGGRMWFDDRAGERIGRGRIQEQMATKAGTIAVACPFCLTMTSDGHAACGSGGTVRDVAEILADSLPEQPS